MNKKEIGEIKRRVRRDRSNMKAVFGCYVNEGKKIISEFRSPMMSLYENEQDKYMALYKKVLSGSLGKNLTDISFPTEHVAGNSKAYQLLFDLRKDALENEELRKEFYQAVIESLDYEGKYLILLGCDTYDVPFKNKNDDVDRDSGSEVFTFVLCAICPVKDTKPNLHYVHEESIFHDGGMIQAVGSPEIGFMYPSFNNRSTDLYQALYYCRKPADFHKDFVEMVLGVTVGQSADEQKQSFKGVLFESLKEECTMDAIVALHEQTQTMLATHKESKNPEALTVNVGTVAAMLSSGGVSDEKIEVFTETFNEVFGEDAEVPVENLVNPKKFNVATENVSMKVDPNFAGQIEVKEINGVKYLLVPVDSFVEVNGITVS